MNTFNLSVSERTRYLGDILRERAQNQPEQTAYIFLGNGEDETSSLTYRELDQQARLIAIALRSLAAPGERALMLYPRELEFVTAFFGCLYAGIVAVPAYPPRRNQKLSRLQAIIADAEATLVLATQDIWTLVESRFSDSELASLHWLTTDNLDSGQQQGEWQEPIVSRETLAFLQYTSGSTGNPKGVMVSHGNLLYNSEYIKQSCNLDQDSVSVTWLPSFHDMGLIDGIIQPLYTGFLGIVMPPASFVQQPLRWLQAISRYRATHCGGPNFGYEICVKSITPGQRETLDLSSWSSAYTGSEPVRRETLEKFAEAFKVSGFRPSFFYPCYGMAETTLMVSGGKLEAEPIYCTVEAESLEQNKIVKASVDTENVRHLVGCGFARLDTQIVIVDPETLTQCVPDQVGEIWVSGSSVAQGYWKRTELTEEIFKARLQDADLSEVEGGSGHFLRTGDLGFLLDGQLFITGRRKDLIIVAGRNHYPQDIELTVEKCHQALRLAGGASFSVDIDGQEKLVIVQEVERTYLRKLNVNEVVRAILQAVAQEHELEVYAIVLIKPASLPKTSSGKVQRSACKARFLENSLDVVEKWIKNSPGQVELQQLEKIPTQSQLKPTFTEIISTGLSSTQPGLPNKSEKVATLQSWLVSKIAEHLQINPHTIDIQAPFVSYGLDSVATVRLTGELENCLGERVSPTLVYDYPNIAALVSHLSQVLNGNGSELKLDNRREIKTTTYANSADEPIAIIGLSCRFPEADNPEAFWQLLRKGVDAITEIPKNRWDINTFYSSELETPGKMSTRWGGFLDKVDQFDPDFFGISPREAERMDPQQRLLLEVAWEALENAGLLPSQLSGSDTGVFIGISSNDYSRIQFGEHSLIDAYAGTGNAFSIAANRLSYLLDLQGPSLSVDTACSSSLVAVHLACQSLQNGESTLALVGGVNLILSPELTITFSQARMMAGDGRCKTFDHQADGYVRGEGCGVVVLKRLSDALRDQDNILSLIKGSALNQDGRSNGLTAPNGLAQQRVIQKALQKAGITADQLSYVEAHGTGTPLGDPIEVESLKAVLMEGRVSNHTCLVGSVKTNIGHLESAAGIAGLIKVVLSLQNEEIPPHLHLKRLNQLISLQETSLSIPTYLQPWTTKSRRRFAGVSSFGFGGTNAHIVLESAPDPTLPPNALESPVHLFTLSAKTESALQGLARRYVEFLDTHTETSLGDICLTTNTGRSHFAYRLAVTCESTAQLHGQLSAFLASKPTTGLVTEKLESNNEVKIAFLFTDYELSDFQVNSQLYQFQPAFRQALEDCDRVVHKYWEKSLLSVFKPEPSVESPLPAEPSVESSAQQTQYAQLISFALQYALAKCWLSWGILPTAFVGYGIGEYVAACISGRIELENCLELLVKPSNCSPSEEMAVVFTEAGKPEARVQWVEVVETLVKQGYTFLIEQGENETLRTQSQTAGIVLVSLNPSQDSLPIILYSLGILYLQGVEIQWTNFYQHFTYRRIPLPTYPFERQRYWLEKPSLSLNSNQVDSCLIDASVSSTPLTKERLTRQKLLAVRQEYRLEMLQSYLGERLAEVLGHSTAKFDVERSIINFGIDSLMSLQLKRRIESDLIVVVPETKFLQGPTITELALFLLNEIIGLDGASTTLDGANKISNSEGEGLSLRSPSLTSRPATFASMTQKVSESQSFPVSFPQERMWFLNSLSPENPVYNFQMAIRLSGEVNLEALNYSIQEVIHRHETLRTTYRLINNQPSQIIAEELKLPLSVIDLTKIVENAQTEEAKKLAASEARQPFNLVDGPLLRTTLICLNAREYVFVLTSHHIISDYWSMRLFIQEMGIFYQAYCTNHVPSLEPLSFHYKDFAHWQRESLQGKELENDLTYWRKKLAALPPALELPLDLPRPTVRSYQGATHFFSLSPSLSQSLQEFSRQQGVTLFMTLMTIFKILLHYYAEQEDIVVASPVSGRVRGETEKLIGMFSYPIVLRTDLSGNPTVQELLVRVRETLLEAYTHQNVPLAKVVEIARSQGHTGEIPLIQVMFSFTSMAMNTTEFFDLAIEPLEIDRGMTDFDLFLTMFEESQGLRGMLEYDTDLFAPETINQMIEHFEILLESVGSQSTKHLSELAAKVPVQKKLTVAISSTFTAEPIEDCLSFWLRTLKIKHKIEFAPYNQIFQQLLDPNSLLSRNQTGINVLLIRWEDWVRYEDNTMAETDAQLSNFQDKITRNIQDLLLALKNGVKNSAASYLVCLCPASPTTLEKPEYASLLSQMEQEFIAQLEAISGVYVVTTVSINRLYPTSNYYDPHGDEVGHIPFTDSFFTAMGTTITRKIHKIKSISYKVIVVDADQTLWQGVYGEDGVEGLKITPPYQAMQSFLVAQYEAGMLICLCSKNNEADVLQVFEQRSDMILKMEQIVAYRANWQPKSENIKSLAQELQLDLNSFIMLDDNPLECAEIQNNCPEVLTLQVPKPEQIPQFIEHIWAFDTLKITEEDKRRTALYQENAQRERLRQKALNLTDFITSLELKVEISPLTEHQVARLSQLTQRTNQLNTTTIRRSETEIQQLYTSKNPECLTVTIQDRFGDYGLVGAIIFTVNSDTIEVDSFMLSCRAMGRGVKHQMLAKLGEIAHTRQLEWVKVYYNPTHRNQPTLKFLESVGLPFKEPYNEGLCFKFPAKIAASVTYGTRDLFAHNNPQISSQSENSSQSLLKNRPGSLGVPHFSAILAQIARELFEVEPILQAIKGLQQRTRQNILVSQPILPQNQVEEELANIWKEVLHLDLIGINDNFFNLGGRSVHLVQVNSRIREVFNQDISLIEMFQHTTIKALAQYLNPDKKTKKSQASSESRSRGERRRKLMQTRANSTNY